MRVTCALNLDGGGGCASSLIPDGLERYSVGVPAGSRARLFCLIIVLICVPALTRVHQPLGPGKASASFSFRKSVDHPPDKMDAPSMTATVATPLLTDDVPRVHPAPVAEVAYRSQIEDSPDSLRGPPQI